ncbi:MAG TPA: metalloregulator ArsR/SmtB family transcription factor [Candidatus Saccharimonadales bacterium]|nr:metalloregulator ArsR/SmtB family transcription factor [Candidatus Saccharimonadales bacterium]
MLKTSTPLAADVFFALGDKTRLSIIERLSRGSGMSATFLSKDAQATRQNIAKHLQVLEGAGLVTHNKQGREVLYALEHQRVEEAQRFLENISAGWDRAIDRLRKTVETTNGR